MLIPSALANLSWVSPTNWRRATMSSPDLISPRMRRLRTLALMARPKDSSVSSGISSLMMALHVRAEPLDLALGREARTDDPNGLLDPLRPDDSDDARCDRTDGEEAFLT